MTIKRDANQLAARILRFALRNHDERECRRAIDMRKAHRTARAELRKMPAPRTRLGPRVMRGAMTPEEIARIGRIDGLLD